MRLSFFASCGLVLIAATSASAQPVQAWPQHTVRLITPLGPGSGMDVAARLFAERLSQKWGQPVVVENRQGADGILAVQSFMTDRDNHSLIFGFAGLISINPLIHGDKLPYDPRDVVPVQGGLARAGVLVGAHDRVFVAGRRSDGLSPPPGRMVPWTPGRQTLGRQGRSRRRLPRRRSGTPGSPR